MNKIRKVLCELENKIIYYYKGKIYYNNGLQTKKYIKLISLPMSPLKKILCKIRIFERLLRLEPRVACRLNNNFLLSFNGGIYKLNVEKKECILEHTFRKGMSNALNISSSNNRYIYGEYFENKNREKVSIYERFGEKNWKKIYTFNDKIKHIHNIVYDEFRNCYWILTGDNDEESGIWYSNMDFTNVKKLIIGKQKYRSVFLHPKKEGLYYITDDPFHINNIYFINLMNKRLEEPKKIVEVSGPCINGLTINQNLFLFSTSVEPNPNLSNFKYMTTNKIASGIKDKYSHLYLFETETNELKELNKFKKDILPMGLFQFGNIFFTKIENDIFLINGQAVKKIDGKSEIINLNERK